MELNSLYKTTNKKKKRLGQGHGSGRVKTSGRGTKGQNARSSRPLSFEGGALTLIKRLPFRRGKGRNKVFKNKPLIVNVKALALLKKDSIVDLDALVKSHIIDEKDARMYGVKVLGDGDLAVSLIVKVPVSKGAKKKIEKAGGRVEHDSIKNT
ncbi:MAG: 50S ribosomal protein L15 [Candidatus Levybacteria bacterium]|nr:50S ribosomal protein L15 [Candidatus Levybacteria bacterium]